MQAREVWTGTKLEGGTSLQPFAEAPQRCYPPSSAGWHEASRGAHMTKPRERSHEDDERTKKKPGGQQHQNPPGKTGTDNPERNPRDQKGRGGSK